MKRTSKKDINVAETLGRIHEQLAVLDQKLDAFMTKSLTELAGAMAAKNQAVAPRPHPVAPPVSRPVPPVARRPMFAVICYECGKDCEIPFKPSGNRPVYCPQCFAKRKAERLQARIGVTDKAPTVSPTPATASQKKPAKAKKLTTKKKPAAKKSPKKKPAAKKKGKKK